MNKFSCDTCTDLQCGYHPDNSDPSFADYRMYKRIQKVMSKKGCASHSSAQSERDKVLDDIEQRLIAIQAGTEPQDRISFKSVYQIINEHRT